MLWNVLPLFVSFVSQCLHPSIHPPIPTFGRFLLEIFLNFLFSTCNLLIDLDFPSSSFLEPRYSQQTEQWEVMLSYPFLDSARLEKDREIERRMCGDYNYGVYHSKYSYCCTFVSTQVSTLAVATVAASIGTG